MSLQIFTFTTYSNIDLGIANRKNLKELQRIFSFLAFRAIYVLA